MCDFLSQRCPGCLRGSQPGVAPTTAHHTLQSSRKTVIRQAWGLPGSNGRGLPEEGALDLEGKNLDLEQGPHCLPNTGACLCSKYFKRDSA